MVTEITMPKMGFDMEAGTLSRWLKSVGDPVQQGEAIAEIETDKATVELRVVCRWRPAAHPGRGGPNGTGRDARGPGRGAR